MVVPAAQGAPYRNSSASVNDDSDADEVEEQDGEEDDTPKKRKGKDAKTKVAFIEDIPPGRFFLRVGLGRKASGSYYTPHPFVRFLVQETLGPQLAERSPKEDPQPGRILELKVLDPAMGSGHFLVEACRYLGDALYEACRLCDELAVQAEENAAKATEDAKRAKLLERAAELQRRVADLPDPDDELVAYLPSRAVEGMASGLSQRRAQALCRRLVAVHCLYGASQARPTPGRCWPETMRAGPCVRRLTRWWHRPTGWIGGSTNTCCLASATGATRRPLICALPPSMSCRPSGWKPSASSTIPTGTFPSTRTCQSR